MSDRRCRTWIRQNNNRAVHTPGGPVTLGADRTCWVIDCSLGNGLPMFGYLWGAELGQVLRVRLMTYREMIFQKQACLIDVAYKLLVIMYLPYFYLIPD